MDYIKIDQLTDIVGIERAEWFKQETALLFGDADFTIVRTTDKICAYIPHDTRKNNFLVLPL